MRRRRLLAALSATTGLAGCGGRLPFGPSADTSTSTPTASPAQTIHPEPERGQWVSVKNTRATSTYLTVVVEGEHSFFDSAELFPGEELRFPTASAPGSKHEVILETADGERSTYEWNVDPGFDGLAAYLTGDGVEFWRAVRCRPDCQFSTSADGADLPLIGDGTGRWYAPASIVLRNPTAAVRSADIAVSVQDATVLNAQYRLPERAQLTVPTTYRSGTYAIRLETDGQTVENEWRVPEVPQRHLVLGESIEVGCGPATPRLTVANNDATQHQLTVSLHQHEELQFFQRITINPGETSEFTPVSGSGRYDVQVEYDGQTVSETWWACPPRDAATLLVDATGTVSLLQGGPQPG